MRRTFTHNFIFAHEDNRNTFRTQYSATCFYAPFKALENSWLHGFVDPNPEGLALQVRNYFREITLSGIEQETLSIVNFPLSEEEFGGYALTYFTPGFREFVNMTPLPPEDLARIQKTIGTEFPRIWGLPDRPYSAIPEERLEDEALELGQMIATAEEFFRRQGIPLELPSDLTFLGEAYRRRN